MECPLEPHPVDGGRSFTPPGLSQCEVVRDEVELSWPSLPLQAVCVPLPPVLEKVVDRQPCSGWNIAQSLPLMRAVLTAV